MFLQTHLLIYLYYSNKIINNLKIYINFKLILIIFYFLLFFYSETKYEKIRLIFNKNIFFSNTKLAQLLFNKNEFIIIFLYFKPMQKCWVGFVNGLNQPYPTDMAYFMWAQAMLSDWVAQYPWPMLSYSHVQHFFFKDKFSLFIYYKSHIFLL